MSVFNELLDVADTLLGPKGCPWDREQNFATLRPYLLEETHELLEALDLGDKERIQEELGDCLYALVFIAKLAEQQKLFTMSDAIRTVVEKLIRRHPHVFGELKIESTEDVVHNWEEIKKKEGKKNPIAGIPPSLPSLARAQKVIVKIGRAEKKEVAPKMISEEVIGRRLWETVMDAHAAGVDAESALRAYCLAQEKAWSETLPR